MLNSEIAEESLDERVVLYVNASQYPRALQYDGPVVVDRLEVDAPAAVPQRPKLAEEGAGKMGLLLKLPVVNMMVDIALLILFLKLLAFDAVIFAMEVWNVDSLAKRRL